MDDDKEIQKRLLGAVDGKRVFVVNADEVRIRHEMDFLYAGNGYRYDWFIPKEEIWVDEVIAKSITDLSLAVYHEAHESRLMADGKKYDEAHKICNGTDRLLLERIYGKDQSDRYEYGPRHQPSKRIEGAVCRLQALRDFCEDIEEETLSDEVYSIAAEFDAEDLKEVAREFGVEHALGTKGQLCALILKKVCKKKVAA